MDEISLLDVRLGDIPGFGEALASLTASIKDHDQSEKRKITVTLECESFADNVVMIQATCGVKLSLSEKFGTKSPISSRLYGDDLLLTGKQGNLFKE
jgi:hypothetical protein